MKLLRNDAEYRAWIAENYGGKDWAKRLPCGCWDDRCACAAPGAEV